MKLEGQGALGESKLTRESLDERGYIMVVLLIGMGAAAIWMAAALPAWRQQAIREKEADLVFRGEQYARAIALYYAKNNNTLPPSIDILVSGKYLRKKWKDPVTGLDFTPVGSALPGQGGSQPGGANPLGGRGPVGGSPTGGSPTGGAPSGGLGNTPGSGSVPPRGSGPVQGGPSGSPPGRPGGPGVGGPGPGMQTGISGVRSQSQATSIRLYQGQQIYAAWPFDYAQMMPRIFGAPGGGAPGGGRPGGGPAGGPGGGRGPNAPGVGAPGRGPAGPVGPGGPSGPGGRGPGGRSSGGS